MKLHIEIEMDGAAFDDDKESEVGRILGGFIHRISTHTLVSGYAYSLEDINGNDVGEAMVIDD